MVAISCISFAFRVPAHEILVAIYRQGRPVEEIISFAERIYRAPSSFFPISVPIFQQRYVVRILALGGGIREYRQLGGHLAQHAAEDMDMDAPFRRVQRLAWSKDVCMHRVCVSKTSTRTRRKQYTYLVLYTPNNSSTGTGLHGDASPHSHTSGPSQAPGPQWHAPCEHAGTNPTRGTRRRVSELI